MKLEGRGMEDMSFHNRSSAIIFSYALKPNLTESLVSDGNVNHDGLNAYKAQSTFWRREHTFPPSDNGVAEH